MIDTESVYCRECDHEHECRLVRGETAKNAARVCAALA